MGVRQGERTRRTIPSGTTRSFRNKHPSGVRQVRLHTRIRRTGPGKRSAPRQTPSGRQASGGAGYPAGINSEWVLLHPQDPRTVTAASPAHLGDQARRRHPFLGRGSEGSYSSRAAGQCSQGRGSPRAVKKQKRCGHRACLRGCEIQAKSKEFSGSIGRGARGSTRKVLL